MVLLPVELTIGVPLTVEPEGAHVKHCLGTRFGPAHARLFHPVLHEVAAGPFHDPGTQRPAAREIRIILHVGSVAPVVADGAYSLSGKCLNMLPAAAQAALTIFRIGCKARDRTPARGKNWIPPLGQKRADGPLEPPEFDHDEPDGSDAGESGCAPSGGQGDDEGAATGRITPKEPNPYGQGL